MTKDEYEDFALRYKGCGACFPMYHTLSRFEKMWFSAIQKDVATLEKENERLTVSYETLKLHDEEEIGMLKSENAELKDDNKVMADNYSKMEQKFYDNLTKAKELLKKWVELYKPKLEGYPITPIQEQTEQFLKE